MNWTDLPGTYLLSKVFSSPPAISEICIQKIELQEDGPTVLILFDLVGLLPDLPLKQWGDFNRCRLGVNCGSVKNLLVEGWGTNNFGFLKIEVNLNHEYTFLFAGTSTKLNFYVRIFK